MLLILSASSFRKSTGAGQGMVDLLDLPRRAHDILGLRGLALPTDMLAGADAARLDRLRERADKASCPVLFLIETETHSLSKANPESARVSCERIERVLTAAHRLGCSAAAISLTGPDKTEALETAAERLKPLAARAERLDLSLLISPTKGLTETPDRVADLIKKVGGFRVGSMPDFKGAAESGDSTTYLRRLAPYAPLVMATTVEFDAEGGHKPYSLIECAEALVTVGFDGSVALDYRGKDSIETGLRLTKEALEPLLLGAEG